MTHGEKVKLVARIIKKQVNLTGGMSNEQAVVLAYQIVEALNKSETKVEVRPNDSQKID